MDYKSIICHTVPVYVKIIQSPFNYKLRSTFHENHKHEPPSFIQQRQCCQFANVNNSKGNRLFGYENDYKTALHIVYLLKSI